MGLTVSCIIKAKKHASKKVRASKAPTAALAIHAATDFTRCYPPGAHGPTGFPYTPAQSPSDHARRALHGANAHNSLMPMLSSKSTLMVALAAAASLSLSACVAPGYAPYGAQQGYQGQAPAYSQPAYAQPGTVQQPAYAAPAPQQPYDTQNNGQYGGQYDSQYSNQYGNQAGNQYGSQYGAQYGTISNIAPISGATGASGIAGTVVGALVGGVVGNQFGRGHGRDAATVIGALGGAYAGNQIGQQMGQPAGYRIDVQLSDGSMRSFNVPSPGDLRPGDRVQVNGNQLARY